MANSTKRRGRPRKSPQLSLDEFLAVLELAVENAKRHQMLESILVIDNKLKVAFCVPLFGLTQYLPSSARGKPVAEQSPTQLRMPL